MRVHWYDLDFLQALSGVSAMGWYASDVIGWLLRNTDNGCPSSASSSYRLERRTDVHRTGKRSHPIGRNILNLSYWL